MGSVRGEGLGCEGVRVGGCEGWEVGGGSVSSGR